MTQPVTGAIPRRTALTYPQQVARDVNRPIAAQVLACRTDGDLQRLADRLNAHPQEA